MSATNQTGWRYGCPHGHTTVVRKRAGTEKTDPYDRWYCQTCGDHYQTVRDKKTGKQVSP